MKRLAFLGALLLAALPAVGQGVVYSGEARTTAGPVAPGAKIYVCASSASLTNIPCTPQTTIYSDSGLSAPITQPLLADGNGNFNFYAAPGNYVISIVGTGLVGRTFSVPVGMPNAALKPAASDAVQFVTANGNDMQDGLSFGSAKGNADVGVAINAAIQALPAKGGWVYLSPGSSCYTFATQIIFDRPVHLVSALSSFSGHGACIDWTGVASQAIVINGTSGASSGSLMEGIDVQNGGTGTVGIDVYNGQYDVTLRDVTVEDASSTPFSVAGVRLGNNTTGSAVINAHLEHVRIANQTIGLQSLFVNEASCTNCSIYGGNPNVQVGDSTHLTTNLTFFGGNIEQDSGTNPSVIVNNVETLNFFGVYTETTGGNWLQIPTTATEANGVNSYGGRFQMNSVTANLFDVNFVSAQLGVDGALALNPGASSNWVDNHTSKFIFLNNLNANSLAISVVTGSTANIFWGPLVTATSIVSPQFPSLTLASSGGGTILHQAPNTASSITVTDPVATTPTPVAGSCTMTTTTCTITVVSGASKCISTDQGGTIAGQCAISGTTLTVTAASSNTSAWAVLWW